MFIFFVWLLRFVQLDRFLRLVRIIWFVYLLWFINLFLLLLVFLFLFIYFLFIWFSWLGSFAIAITWLITVHSGKNLSRKLAESVIRVTYSGENSFVYRPGHRLQDI